MKKTLVFIILLMIIPLIIAPPTPQISDNVESLEIIYPKYYYVPQNASFHLHFHVLNTTTVLTNSTASCLVHLYNPMGSHTAELLAGMDSNNIDYEVQISNGNFSVLGTHAYIIQCNTSRQTGFASGEFEISPQGYPDIETGEAIIIFLTVMIMLFISLGLIISSTNFQNNFIKFVLITLGLVIMIAPLLYNAVILQQVNFEYSLLVNGYEYFLWVLRIFATFLIILLFGFVIYFVYLGFKNFVTKYRGFDD